jgi:transaldolase
MKIGARKVKLFQDGADLEAMVAAKRRNLVAGFTTNPTLMRKAGIADYKAFALKVIAAIPDLPISFGKDLNQYSLETVKMFYDDARAAGFKIV